MESVGTASLFPIIIIPTMAKTHHADAMNIDRTVKCTAEAIIIHGETVVVDKRLDVIKARRKEKVSPWTAELIGTMVVEHGETKEEAIAAITERVNRRLALNELQKLILRRKGKAAMA